MIRHQTVRMHRAPRFARECFQVAQISQAISVTEEATGAIVPSLNHVERDTGNDRSGASGHPEKTADTRRQLTKKMGYVPIFSGRVLEASESRESEFADRAPGPLRVL